jgi:hypothetical protein
MGFCRFLYNYVVKRSLKRPRKMPFLDIFQKRVKNIFYVGERHFLGSLQERNPIFYQYRFYVGDLRRLREISPLFCKNGIFSAFFGFF